MSCRDGKDLLTLGGRVDVVFTGVVGCRVPVSWISIYKQDYCINLGLNSRLRQVEWLFPLTNCWDNKSKFNLSYWVEEEIGFFLTADKEIVRVTFFFFFFKLLIFWLLKFILSELCRVTSVFILNFFLTYFLFKPNSNITEQTCNSTSSFRRKPTTRKPHTHPKAIALKETWTQDL